MIGVDSGNGINVFGRVILSFEDVRETIIIVLEVGVVNSLDMMGVAVTSVV